MYIDNTHIEIMLRILIFIFVFLTFYFVASYLSESKIIQNSVDNFYKRTIENERGRREKEILIRQEDGVQDEHSLLYKLDLLIINSNIKKFFPFINTEIYIALIIITSAISFFLINFITGYWIMGVFGIAVVTIIFVLVIYVMAGINHKKTEENILTFVNLLENYSQSTDDIFAIFGRVYHYLEEPLRSAIEDCFYDGQTGDKMAALNNLENKIEHGKFKEIIRNLNIASRHEANYAEIIEDSREMLRDYMANKQERHAAIQTGRIEVGIITLAACIVFYMLDQFLANSIMSVLLGTTVGNFLLLYVAIIIVVSIVKLMSFDKAN